MPLVKMENLADDIKALCLPLLTTFSTVAQEMSGGGEGALGIC